MKSNEKIEKTGEVIEALPDAFFRIKLEDGSDILARLSGKMRLNFIKVLPGDKVIVEFSPYNLKKGRIIRRI